MNKANSVPPKLETGYPENVPKTQTKKTKGTGAATKGTKHSSNSQ